MAASLLGHCFFGLRHQAGTTKHATDPGTPIDPGSTTANLGQAASRSLPFWPTSPRDQRAAKIWGHGLRVESMPLGTWCDRVLPDAARDGLVIGINWSGPRLVGWSFTPKEVLNRLAVAN
ncbi:DUF2750 domain-containing protein [Streptomyces shenzhenensis]|uniref:DUF2750 domain-containing protein n=1 Tax=Streptomyces shenzhenensis TaxID=943815 RepID=UPI0033DB785C